MTAMTLDRNQRVFLVILVVFISAAFVAMIRQFLLTLLMAAIFSGLTFPLFARLQHWFRGRGALAAGTTLLILFLVVIIPLLLFVGVLVAQAVKVSHAVTPWIQEQLRDPDQLTEQLRNIPGFDRLEPYREPMLNKAGELVGAVGNFMVNSLSTATKGTVQFIFHFFLLFYSMFFFYIDGGKILDRVLTYIPLPHADEARMVDRFVSVARATLKGTVVIGVVQGGLAGVALAMAGIQGAVFWGTVMVVLSVIPGLGTAVVWLPAAIYLIIAGETVTGVALIIFCAVVVGSADNFLRPVLVGKDTQMHELLILLSTLGGLLFFGVMGFIIGPILGALFITVWDIYGTVFKDVLPRPER